MLLDLVDDPALFGDAFGPSWAPWRAFLAAVEGQPLGADGLDLYRRCTGRETPPTTPSREVYAIVGRRGGKSRIAALLAVDAACFHEWTGHLAPGERATVAVIAADRQQARTVFRYILGLLDAVPILRAQVVRRTKAAVELANRCVIEVTTASARTTRGYTFACVVADELAFWRSSETAAEPDVEVLAAVRPGLTTLPGARLVCISSPYAQRGALHQAFRAHYGRDGDAVLVWKADTATMNPAVDGALIAAAYEADPASAAAEYGAEFRRDISGFIERAVVDAVVVPGRHALPPAKFSYVAFLDPSGGAGDSFTCAIAHAEERDGETVAVLDVLLEKAPPFNASVVVREFAATLRAYGITSAQADRYAGVWVTDAFAAHGIDVEQSAEPKSVLYGNALPLMTSGRCELLDHPRLVAQLVGLERKTARSGRDSIDHCVGSHDDVANAACGALLLAAEPGDACAFAASGLAERPYVSDFRERLAAEFPGDRDILRGGRPGPGI